MFAVNERARAHTHTHTHTHIHTGRLLHCPHLFRKICGHLLPVLRNFKQQCKNSLTLLQEVKSDLKDSRSLPFFTKHPCTWTKTSQLLTLPGRKRGDFVKILLPKPRQSNDRLSKFCFLDLPSLSREACRVLYNISPTSGSFYWFCPFMVLH